jgi:alpha-tubulin suppressor-like RCC1 family protein
LNKISTPTQIKYFKNKKIDKIFCGDKSTIVILENNEIYAFGSIDGIGSKINPTRIQIFEDLDISDFLCGDEDIIAISNRKAYQFINKQYNEINLNFPQNDYMKVLIRKEFKKYVMN